MRHWTLGVMALALGACSDDPKKRLGETCGDNEECISGLCSTSVCIDPEGDEDQDGLINSFEIQIGSDPFSPDSDGDGILDADELDPGLVVRDTDGDGKPDILESRTRDGDGDCLPDELDPIDDAPATKEELLAHRVELCGAQGLCASATQGIDIQCVNQEVRCDYSNITGYQVEELSCDGIDNDCDGRVDEGCNATAAPPQVTVGSADAWTQETADVPVQGSGFPNSTVLLSQSANCWQPTMVTVDANGQFSQTLTLDRSQANLYAQAIHNGELSACVLVQDLFGPIVLHIETSARTLDLRPVQFHYPDGSPAGVEVSDEEGSVKLPSAIPGMMVTLIVASPEFNHLGSGNGSEETRLRTIQGLQAGSYRVAFADAFSAEMESVPFQVRVPGMTPSRNLSLLSTCGETTFAWQDESGGTDVSDIQAYLPGDCFQQQDLVEMSLVANNDNGEVASYAYLGWLTKDDLLGEETFFSPNRWQSEGLSLIDLVVQSQAEVSFTNLFYAQTASGEMLLTSSENTYYLGNGSIEKFPVVWPPMQSIERVKAGFGIYGTLAAGQSFEKLLQVPAIESDTTSYLQLDLAGVPVPREVVANTTDSGLYTNVYIKGWPDNYQPTLAKAKVRAWDEAGVLEWDLYAPSKTRGEVVIPSFSLEFKVNPKLTTLGVSTSHFIQHVAFDYLPEGVPFMDQVNRIIEEGWELEYFHMSNDGNQVRAVRPVYSFLRSSLSSMASQ